MISVIVANFYNFFTIHMFCTFHTSVSVLGIGFICNTFHGIHCTHCRLAGNLLINFFEIKSVFLIYKSFKMVFRLDEKYVTLFF